MADPYNPPGVSPATRDPNSIPAPITGIDEAPVYKIDAQVANTAGDVPPVQAPTQPHWHVRAAQLQAEYVSGGGYIFLANYIRSLPHYIDDTTRDFGDDLYERMMLDPQVNSSVRLLKLASLANGVRLESAIPPDNEEEEQQREEHVTSDTDNLPIPDEDHPQQQQSDDDQMVDDQKDGKTEADLSAEITEFCQDCLDNLERPLMDVLYEMLDMLALGNKVAEQIYELVRDENNVPRMRLKSLKVKPRQSTAFVVDAYLNVIGLLALLPGRGYPVVTGSIVGDPSQLPNMLPREKFAILSWSRQNGDPRGTSLLRCVYNPWFLKMQVWGEYAKYLAQFAGPSLIGFTAPGAQVVPATDSLGNVIPGAPMVTPEQAMLTALLNFRNGTAVAFPHGASVTPLTVGGDGSAFMQAIELFDHQIAKGILGQTLATEQGVYQARAAAQMHQDVLDLIILQIKYLVGSMIRDDILRPLVRYNWGDDIARRMTPKVHLAQTERHNWAENAAAVASLVTSQYLDYSQFRELDTVLGLPKRKDHPAPSAGMPGAMPGTPGAMPNANPAATGASSMPQNVLHSTPMSGPVQPPAKGGPGGGPGGGGFRPGGGGGFHPAAPGGASPMPQPTFSPNLPTPTGATQPRPFPRHSNGSVAFSDRFERPTKTKKTKKRSAWMYRPPVILY